MADNARSQAVPTRASTAMAAIRVAVAVLILIHGLYRLTMGGIAPFGVWLDAQGLPMGHALATAVTIYELVGPVMMLLGRFVSLAAIGHLIILTLGLVMVHMPFGWFVVGAGRNGMEYSVLLIVALGAIAWTYWPRGNNPFRG